MSVLRPLDKLPSLNTATILVGAGGPASPAGLYLLGGASATRSTELPKAQSQ